MDDGSYDLHLNRFFRACPGMGARSPNTWRSYARDILVWARFLSERRGGKTVWQVNRHDVLAFHRARRLSDAAFRISAASWNRSVAALDKLYRWAVEEGIITTSPFSYGVTLRRSAGTGAVLAVTTNRARERAARRHNMRYIDLGRYLLFRDVGLRGRLPDGTEDSTWRGRNGERNALFAELLVTTGLRLSEGGSLLLTELPRVIAPGPRSVLFDLSGSIAKGGRPRQVRIPRRVLALIQDYIDLERAVSSARSEPSVTNPLWLAPEGEQIGAVFDPQDRHGAAYRRILGDPLQKLQHLLGHASLTSTYIYLDSLAEAQELVEAAADRWAQDTAGDAQ